MGHYGGAQTVSMAAEGLQLPHGINHWEVDGLGHVEIQFFRGSTFSVCFDRQRTCLCLRVLCSRVKRKKTIYAQRPRTIKLFGLGPYTFSSYDHIFSNDRIKTIFCKVLRRLCNNCSLPKYSVLCTCIQFREICEVCTV